MTTNENNAVEVNLFAVALNDRVDYETAKTEKKMTQANIDKIARFARVVSNEKVLAFLSSNAVDANALNASRVANTRLNVYTLAKVENVLQFITSAARLNDMNYNVFRTALALTKAKLSMTRDDAKDACSASRKSKDAAKRALIVQNTKHVDESTVQAQHASTLQALTLLNVLTVKRDASNVDCYTVNMKNTIAKELSKRLES